MTYDRAVVKLDTDRVKPLHDALYAPPARTDTVLPISGGPVALAPALAPP